MSHGVVGANVEQLDQLAGRMQQAADQVGTIVAQLSASPRQVWVGQDAARFFADLDSVLLPQLRNVSTGLAGANVTLRRNAEEQRVASGAGGSADGGFPGGGFSGGGGGGGGGGGRGSGTDRAWFDSVRAFLGNAKDGLSGFQTFAEASAADAKNLTFWGFDPKAAPSKLGRLFEAGGYALSGVNLLANLGAAADGDTGAMGAVTSNVGSILGGVSKLAESGGRLSPALSGVGGGLTVGGDILRIKEALDNGQPWSAVYHGVHGVVAGVGTAVPPVALGLAAWDGGTAIGTAIGESPVAHSFYDRVVAEGAAQSGSGVADRYAGIAGVGNMARDGLVVIGNTFSGLLRGK